MDNKATKRTTIEQGRAAFAYSCAVKGAALDKQKEYKSYIKKLPMLIKTNGLGAAIAFAFAKGSKGGIPEENKAWGLIYAQIEHWLTREDEKSLIKCEKNKLAKRLTEIDSFQYRAVTVEVLALLGWMKRFSEALIEGESED